MANHRYTLRRSWLGDGRVVNFIMLNPSTADDVFDDATIRRCVGFAKRWGFSGIVVTNLFAYRATQPSDLRQLLSTNGGFRTAIGEDNTSHIDREAKGAKMVVCAWGDNCDVLPHRDLDVVQMLRVPDQLYFERCFLDEKVGEGRGGNGLLANHDRHFTIRLSQTGACR